MPKARVAILRTKPETVRADYHRLMNLANYQDYIDKTADTGLKVNISWHFFYPGSSTVPWQLDGVVHAMLEDGYERDLIHACHNRTVVIDSVSVRTSTSTLFTSTGFATSTSTKARNGSTSATPSVI
jgi:hypothetical protein